MLPTWKKLRRTVNGYAHEKENKSSKAYENKAERHTFEFLNLFCRKFVSMTKGICSERNITKCQYSHCQMMIHKLRSSVTILWLQLVSYSRIYIHHTYTCIYYTHVNDPLPETWFQGMPKTWIADKEQQYTAEDNDTTCHRKPIILLTRNCFLFL